MSDAISSAGYDAAEEFEGRNESLGRRLQGYLHSYPWLSPLAVLIFTVAAFGIITHGKTVNPASLGVIAQQTAVIGTLALGQTLIVMTAGIDLSCGAIAVFAMMVMAKLTFSGGVPAPLAILIGVVIGLLSGLLNGLLITRVKLPPFIVTLGTLGIFTSLTLLYATGRTIQGDELPAMHKWLGHIVNVGGLPLSIGVFVMIGLYVLFSYILRYTAWGRHVYATGDDVDAARLAGISTNRVTLSVYAVAGLVFGIAAWILIGRIGAAGPNTGPTYNLDAITAVVIGGTSLFGGRGRIVGSLLGALLVNEVTQGLAVAGIDQAWRPMSIGILIIGAVSVDQWIRKARK